MKHIIGYIVLSIFTLTTAIAQQKIGIKHLQCEMLTDPLGIDVQQPRLSWQLDTEVPDVMQTHYQVLVASTPDKLTATQADYWNSGKVTSDNAMTVRYAGKKINDKTQVYWKVKVWTTQGETAWSNTATWSTGITTYTNWRSTRWIGHDQPFAWDSTDKFSVLSARYLRKEFTITKELKNAKVYIMGLGLYELYMNGNKIGNQVLAPVPTDYTENVKYNVFDVTEQLSSGTNTLGTILGNGRYFAMRHYKAYKVKNFGFPKMALQLELEYTDGTSEIIKTDESWKLTGDGPIRSNNEYDGEIYDAPKEMHGWSTTGFDDSNWLDATYVHAPGGFPEAQMTPNMAVMDTVYPKSITKTERNTYILDMGQNMVGWLQIQTTGKTGDEVQLKFAESLTKDGDLYIENLRDAKVTDTYILKGEGIEIWEPTFIFHGFRYVEISGYRNIPKLTDFIGKVVYDHMQTTGSFESSNATLNQIFKNAFWGIRGNYKGMPIDCPQRNERQPWLGDRTTGAYGESFLFDNHTLYAKWLDDIRYSQTKDGGIPDVAPAFWNYYGDDVTWPGTYITVANMLYHQYGDKEVIAKNYNAMNKWIWYMYNNYMKDGLMTRDRYGDWCVPPESLELIHATDPSLVTEGKLIASAFYYHLLGIMIDFAEITGGHEADSKAFKEIRIALRSEFNKTYFNNGTNTYANNTITANLLPLNFGIVPEAHKEKVFKNMVTAIETTYHSHISTGVIGTQFLMRTLAEFGRPDLAFTIASNTTYPSWGYMAENGATTIWELWNGNTANPKMNSQNHVMLLGDLMIWYFEHLAGIKSSETNPGFKEIIMKPDFSVSLEYVKASYQSNYGRISSNWKKKRNKLYWDITIPANSTAKIYVPQTELKKIKLNGNKLTNSSFAKILANSTLIELPSGTYYVEVSNYKN